MSLDDIRREIDGIDSRLLDLFVQRMRAVERVTEEKISRSLPVVSQSREDTVLRRAKDASPAELSGYATAFFYYLMELSKNRERDLIRSRTNEESAFIRSLNRHRPEIQHPKVVVQGVRGSYSTSAALAMYPDGELSFVERWENVLDEVAFGNVDYGVLPVENSAAGSVIEVYDLLLSNRFYIVKAKPIPVRHCLLGVRGAHLSDIRAVYSHPHAFPQCSAFFRDHRRLQKIPYINTAAAAQKVARDGRPDTAALASADCAHLYGLDILAEAVQDTDGNCTRFISISRQLEMPEDANKISIVFTLPHITGSLYRALARFALNGLSITKIESRPNAEKNFEYYFYLDFIGSLKSRMTLSLLSSLSEELPSFSFLGNYRE